MSGAKYMDPAILRPLTAPAPRPSPVHETFTVTSPHASYKPGDRVNIREDIVDESARRLTVSVSAATVVSWDRVSGELVVARDEKIAVTQRDALEALLESGTTQQKGDQHVHQRPR